MNQPEPFDFFFFSWKPNHLCILIILIPVILQKIAFHVCEMERNASEVSPSSFIL